MFSTFNTLMVIIVLEVICCLYSLALAYMSDKKFGKVLNGLMAAIWAIAAILNVVGFQFFIFENIAFKWVVLATFGLKRPFLGAINLDGVR